jgi:hypothetical protein
MLTTVSSGLRRLWTRDQEQGQALLFVLIAVTLLTSVPIAIATTTIDELPQTTRNLNYEAAYEAAQAGLNDYIQNLDSTENYSSYTASNPDPTNPAFGGWVQASTSPPEYYSYAPSNTSGLITLEVSGKAGTGSGVVIRTFEYSIEPATTLDDVYWSNYETIDPALGSAYKYCGVHYGQANPNAGVGGNPAYGPLSSCEVNFAHGDVLNGPVFSDDTFRMCDDPGATFESTVQSGNIYNTNTTPASSKVWVTGQQCPNPTAVPSFQVAVQKVGNETAEPPGADLSDARSYGCFITGGSGNSLTPINVTITLSLTGTAPNQTTKVTGSWSAANVDNAAGNTNTCTSGLSLSNLASGLIFVNGNVSISGQMTGGLDVVTCSTTSYTNNQCTEPSTSNITVAGSLTYPTANKVLASGQPTSDPTDALGLIAQNFVVVSDTPNIEIDAAILAVQDSFYVSNWSGATGLGTLNVFGSIAQNYRGPVATSGGTGFLKNYNYDTSLQTLFPPYFIPPSGATWSPTSYEECGSGNNASVLNTPQC